MEPARKGAPRIDLMRLHLPLSLERIESYRLPGDSESDAIARYLWNLELCQALYPTLHAAEIGLRNAIHAGMTEKYGTDNWFNNPASLEPNQFQTCQRITDELIRRGKPTNSGRVIAQLSFGFWVTMLSKPYEARNWSGDDNQFLLLRSVFPHAKRKEQRRHLIYRRFANINILRNRVFHYEPVWNGIVTFNQTHAITDLHAAALDAVRWISPELREIIRVRDSFLKTYESGREEILDDLRRHVR